MLWNFVSPKDLAYNIFARDKDRSRSISHVRITTKILWNICRHFRMIKNYFLSLATHLYLCSHIIISDLYNRHPFIDLFRTYLCFFPCLFHFSHDQDVDFSMPWITYQSLGQSLKRFSSMDLSVNLPFCSKDL